MASQRITIAKVGGVAADRAARWLGDWSALRKTNNPNQRSSAQWPEDARQKADDLADRVRAHAFAPPVVYFSEWADLWSMGDMFEHWLMPPDAATPLVIHANRFEVYGYTLPDSGRLAHYLANAGPQQWTETEWFVCRLREAVAAWQERVARAALLVLRHVVGSSALDEDVAASLRIEPRWLSK